MDRVAGRITSAGSTVYRRNFGCSLEPTSGAPTIRHAHGREYALRICTSARVSCAIHSPKKLDRGITAAPKRAWPPLLCPGLRSPSIEKATAAVPNTHSPKSCPRFSAGPARTAHMPHCYGVRRLASHARTLSRSKYTLFPNLVFGGPLPPAHRRESVLREMPSIEQRPWAPTHRREPITTSSSISDALGAATARGTGCCGGEGPPAGTSTKPAFCSPSFRTSGDEV